jgi:hypothetical protein
MLQKGAVRGAVALAMRGRDLIMTRRPSATRHEIAAVHDIDTRFDRFWQERLSESDELLAIRDSCALRWRFQQLIGAGEAHLLAAEDAGGLAGYVVLRRNDSPEHGIRRWLVVDLQTRRDELKLSASLMAAAIRAAQEQGIQWIEFMGCSPARREALARLAPYAWINPGWRFFYAARHAELGTALQASHVWEPSPFDGDEAV